MTMINPDGVSEFQKAKQQQLMTELDRSQPPESEIPENGEPEQEDLDEPRETELSSAEDSGQEQPEVDDDEDALPEDDHADEDDGGETEAEHENPWQAKAEQAEKDRKSMERDYRRKTHRLSQDTKELASHLDEVKQTQQYLLSEAEQEMAAFNNVNWQQLQTQPEQYQHAQNAFIQAQQRGEQRRRNMKQIEERAAEMKQRNDAAIIEHSRGVLSHQISGWGPDLYGKLREFASEHYDYSTDEFDQIIDWRPMRMAYDAYLGQQTKRKAAEVVKKTGRKSTRKRPAVTAKGQERNAQGQFRKAEREVRAKPNDRSAVREMFRARLDAERR